MGKAGGSVALVLVLLAIPMTVLASPAAFDSIITTVPPSLDPTTGAIGTRGGYASAVIVADVAGTLTLVNADITAHDLISDELGPADNPWCSRYVGHHFCPLFASPIVGLGGQAVVQGTDQLESGKTYSFFCSIHHWMTGTLVAV